MQKAYRFVVFPLSSVTVDFLIAPPNYKLAKKGADVTLDCKVKGFPQPQLVWKKDGELLTNTSRVSVITEVANKSFTSSRLQIRGVTKEDVAVYSCISWNRGSVRFTQTRVLLTGESFCYCY